MKVKFREAPPAPKTDPLVEVVREVAKLADTNPLAGGIVLGLGLGFLLAPGAGAGRRLQRKGRGMR